MTLFTEFRPSNESYWRSIILFGDNSASYKFALGKVLLEFAAQGVNSIAMDDLALPFALNVAEHLRNADRQCTNPSSRFLNGCRKYNSGTITAEELRRITKQFGFTNVIDAFHTVNQSVLPTRFFIDERRELKRIVLTDELLKLSLSAQFGSLPAEVEARWRLVETAWMLRVKTSLLKIKHDDELDMLYVESSKIRRIDITSARDALNGYQKGKCFYCFRDISIKPKEEHLADVDHFFAHILRVLDDSEYSSDLNGIWNLVLACQSCNRGDDGKFARVPLTRYLKRLHTRNSFLIDSHHPMRETLLLQTGATSDERRRFLQRKYDFAKQMLIHEWQPVEEMEAAF